MDSTTRDQIFAAKERLQQLTQVTREDLEREAKEDKREEMEREEATKLRSLNKRKLQAEREKGSQEKKSNEDKRYLQQHNKTVAKVLSQVAKTSMVKTNGSEEEDEEEGFGNLESQSISSDSPSQTGQQKPSTSKNNGERKKENGKGIERETTLTQHRGEF